MNKKPEKDRDELQLYRAIIENMAEGVLLIRARDDVIVYSNPAIERIFGYAAEELAGKPMSIINAPTKKSPQEVAGEIVRSLKADGVWRGDMQNIKKDGTVFCCHVNLSTFEHPQYGNVWVAIHQDVTERKRIEDALKESELKYRSLTESSSDAIFCVDEKGQFKFANHVFASNFRKTPDYFIGKTFWDIYPKEEADLRYELTKRVFQTGKGESFEGEIRLPGKISYFHIRLNPIKDEAGKVVLMLTDATDITARKQAEEKLKEANKLLEEQLSEIKQLQETLREQAVRDSLTGLYNRRYLDEMLERELARARRENYPVSVMMIDIDHFKNFNDIHGHQAGDEILKALGALLRNGIRQGDIACRYGGDEFIVIMPGADKADAEQRAEAIHLNFNSLRINYAGVEMCATVSIGVAFYPQHGDDIDQIIKAADSAMYEAKQAGRNRVCVRKNIS
jgi:diguanylate cyclase (GGDEF)-like protein/PAS domain S-box-containing protein